MPPDETRTAWVGKIHGKEYDEYFNLARKAIQEQRQHSRLLKRPNQINIQKKGKTMSDNDLQEEFYNDITDYERMVACKNPIQAYYYARDVDQCPRDDTIEATCRRDPEWGFCYFSEVGTYNDTSMLGWDDDEFFKF
ncbi:hypothetical protein [Anaerolinea sp.]|uniref:hypothetical protein n=1 Tax=Anaerolinea sp. TaxID=1872519 RepID=UPI002ACE5488|nr:hypothetical protein [Anaerolinea sp.]